MMSLYSFLSAIELGLIYSLMVLGLFLSYRVLNIPDLTVDGSFTLGAAVAVVMTFRDIRFWDCSPQSLLVQLPASSPHFYRPR